MTFVICLRFKSFSAAEDLDLFESVVDGAIDRFLGDLHPGSRHWLRQADDVPVAFSLRFVDVDIFLQTFFTFAGSPAV